MTTFNKIIVLSTVLAFSNIAYGNSTGDKYLFKKLKKISLKCDLVYVGGKKGILYHHDLPVKSKSSFESELIQMNSTSQNKIYKVNECVEISKKFKDATANDLEKKIKLER